MSHGWQRVSLLYPKSYRRAHFSAYSASWAPWYSGQARGKGTHRAWIFTQNLIPEVEKVLVGVSWTSKMGALGGVKRVTLSVSLYLPYSHPFPAPLAPSSMIPGSSGGLDTRSVHQPPAQALARGTCTTRPSLHFQLHSLWGPTLSSPARPSHRTPFTSKPS